MAKAEHRAGWKSLMEMSTRWLWPSGSERGVGKCKQQLTDQGKSCKEPINMSLRHRERLMVDAGVMEQVGGDWGRKGK